MNIYITGIGEKCGKTITASGIAAVMQSLAYKTCVYKPIQTGAEDKGEFLLSPDLAFVKRTDPYITTHASFMYKSDAIPEICGEEENSFPLTESIISDFKLLKQKNDIMITEAPGGLMTPLYDGVFAYDIPFKLQIPVLFVVSPAKGTVNSYLNEINTAKTKGLDIKGVIINNFPVYSQKPEIKSFPKIIEKYSDIEVLGLVRHLNDNNLTPVVLINEILNGIDLEKVFGIKIPKLDV